MTLDWATIATIVLGSSFLGAVFTNLSGLLIRYREHTRQANYVGLHLAYVFETFAYTCLSAAEDNDTAKSSGGHVGNYIKNVPAFPELPDFDYRYLDLGILDSVYDFPGQVLFANASMSFAWQVLDDEELMEEGYKTTLKLAQDSLFIADRIRDRYKLPKRGLEFGGYSVRERIVEMLSEVN
jgi:hypothetical protein